MRTGWGPKGVLIVFKIIYNQIVKKVAWILVRLIHGPGLKDRSFIVVSILSILMYPGIDLYKLLKRSDCFRLHVWNECTRRVSSMKFWQWCP